MIGTHLTISMKPTWTVSIHKWMNSQMSLVKAALGLTRTIKTRPGKISTIRKNEKKNHSAKNLR